MCASACVLVAGSTREWVFSKIANSTTQKNDKSYQQACIYKRKKRGEIEISTMHTDLDLFKHTAFNYSASVEKIV